MNIKTNKLATAQGRAEAMYYSNLVNMELACFDYIYYNKLQSMIGYVIEEAKKCGEYRQQTKLTLNQIKDDIDKLVIACQTSEKTEFSDIVVSPFPNYRYKYMAEGGYFMQSICWQWGQLTNKHYEKLHYAVRNCFLKHRDRIKMVDLSVRLYELLITCQMLDSISEAAKIKLFHYTGINVKEVKMDRFVSLEGKVIKLTNKYVTCETDFDDRDHDLIQMAGQIIVNITMTDAGGKIIGDALKETISDYTEFCIASMLAYVREHGDIEKDDRVAFRKMGLVDSFIDQIVEELKKTHVGEKENDINELKLMVRNIKYCKHLNVFRKAMASVTQTVNKAV